MPPELEIELEEESTDEKVEAPVFDTKSIEEIKTTLGGITAFLKEKAQPAEEERSRLLNAVTGLSKSFDDFQKKRVEDEVQNRRVAVKGPYGDIDAFELHCMKSLYNAFKTDPRTVGDIGEKALKDWGERLELATRALNTTAAAAGGNLIVEGAASTMWPDYHPTTRVASTLPVVDMPTEPFWMPVEFGPPRWYLGVEGKAPADSSPATERHALNSHEIVTYIPWSYNLDEDAVVAVLPELRRMISREAAKMVDNMLLNGDETTGNTNINFDGAAFANTNEEFYLSAFNGLIHRALIDLPGQSGSVGDNISAEQFRKLLGYLGNYASDVGNCIAVGDPTTIVSMLGLSEIQTLDKYGANATILTGEVGRIYGQPVLISGEMKLADADGKITHDGNNVDRGRLLMYHAPSFRLGYRRRLMVEVDRDIVARQWRMVVSVRFGYVGIRAANVEPGLAGLLFNISF